MAHISRCARKGLLLPPTVLCSEQHVSANCSVSAFREKTHAESKENFSQQDATET